jgi:hypothetical protein
MLLQHGAQEVLVRLHVRSVAAHKTYLKCTCSLTQPDPPAKSRSSKVSSFGRGPGVVTRGRLLALERVTLTPSHSSHSSSPVQPQARCSKTWFFSVGGALLVGCKTANNNRSRAARRVDVGCQAQAGTWVQSATRTLRQDLAYQSPAAHY